MPFKFSRSSRLIGRHDFRSVFSDSNKLKHKYLLVLYQVNKKNHARLGMVLGKHFVNRAVDRNFIRRTLRESFRYHQESLKGLDIIVLMRSKWSALLNVNLSKADTKHSTNTSLRNDIDDLWQRLLTSSKQA